jgi:hypothetical protein
MGKIHYIGALSDDMLIHTVCGLDGDQGDIMVAEFNEINRITCMNCLKTMLANYKREYHYYKTNIRRVHNRILDLELER